MTFIAHNQCELSVCINLISREVRYSGSICCSLSQFSLFRLPFCEARITLISVILPFLVDNRVTLIEHVCQQKLKIWVELGQENEGEIKGRKFVYEVIDFKRMLG